MMEMDNQWKDSFREKLDQHYSWPSLYTFKFIVPAGKEGEVKNLFQKHIPTEKKSKNGNYTSITFHMMMISSDAVIEVYVQASVVQGIVAL
ncbi:MAG TPA: DUF493 family protein [Chryseolinea sp.]|nr:DUF493 family protein [Chryseolinea sp.]